ncbi:MAG: archease [Gammaproteobacteria bacterium]|jgi:SHS2 domain-containing protein
MSYKWEHFQHEADIGIRGIGNSKAEAFAAAALAMTAVITDPVNVQAQDVISIHCEAPDDEILLVDWLNALVYEMATRNMLFSQFDIEITNGLLTARCWGEKIDQQRHQPSVEVKGATYTELKVSQNEQHWIAQTVVDV